MADTVTLCATCAHEPHWHVGGHLHCLHPDCNCALLDVPGSPAERGRRWAAAQLAQVEHVADLIDARRLLVDETAALVHVVRVLLALCVPVLVGAAVWAVVA